MRNKTPHVYFVQEDGPKKLIKIGCTTQGALRLQTVKLWCPYPITLLAMMEGSKELEAWFHTKFHEKRTYGEWFLPSKEIFCVIEEIKNTKTFKKHPILTSTLKYKTRSNLDNVLKKFNISTGELAQRTGLSSFTIRCGLPKRSRHGKLYHGDVLSPRSIHLIIGCGEKLGIKLSYEDFYRPARKIKEARHA